MKNNKLVFIILTIVLGICLVACSSETETATKGNISLQNIYYETESGALFSEEESLGIDHFELNGKTFKKLPYNLNNLPGDQYYGYTIKAYDAEGVLMASGSGQWMVVEGYTTVQTAALTVKHQHTFVDTWTIDMTYHWHKSNCGHAAIGNKGQHTFEGDICTVCGYNKKTQHLHTFNSEGVCSVCYLHEATGLYVFYDKGSYSDGWRYLEAAPADLRVVDGVPTVDETKPGYSDGEYRFVFGYCRTTDDGNNLYVNGTETYNSEDCTGKEIGTGKRNTQLLVGAMGNKAYTSESGSEISANYAARLCDILEYTVNGVTYSDWFLPSHEELCEMYTDRAAIGGFSTSMSCVYWSSSENGYYGAGCAACTLFDSGTSNMMSYSGANLRVRPVRAF